MTPEQQRALALARAKQRQAQAKQSSAPAAPAETATRNDPYPEQSGFEYRGSALDRFARGTGEGVANILGAPADLMNAGLEKIGLGTDRPWLGSENIQRGLAMLGSAPQEGVDKGADETLAGQLGQGLGTGVGLLAPWLGAGQKAVQARAAAELASGTSAGRGVVANMVKEAGQRPGLLAAAELGGNVGAAGGRAAAERNGFEDGSVGSTAAQIAGGAVGSLTPAGVAGLGRKAADLSQISLLRRIPESLIERARVSRGGQYSGRTLDKAGQTLQGQASDLNTARASLANADPDTGLSPALQTGDRGLMAVENQVNSASPAAQQAAREAQDAAAQRAAGQIGSAGGNVPLSRTADELQRRQTGVQQQARSRVQQNQQAARQAQDDLGPAVPRADVSREFNDNLEAASREANEQVRNIWRKVDKEAVTGTDNLMSGISRAIDDAGSVDSMFPNGSVPGPLRRLLEQGNDAAARSEGGVITSNIGEMQNLRRILGERAASLSSGANPDRNGARVMSDLVRAIDDDMATASGSGVKEAIAATRQMSDRFRRDGIQRSMARSGSGGEQVQPEQVLERILPLGSQGSSTAGAAGARQIYNAIGTRSGARAIDQATMPEVQGATLAPSSNAPQIHKNVEDYLSGEFLRRAAPDGQLTSQGARKFLRDNQSTLDLPQFSDLRTRLRTAADMQARGESSEARMASLMDRMNDPAQSRAAMFMGRDTADGTYQDAIRNVTRGNAGDNMRQLVRQVRKDPTGDALNGLKSGFTRHLLSEIRSSDGLPDAARLNSIFGDSTGRSMAGNDASLQRAARELFNQTERRRLRQAADSIAKVQQSRAAGTADADLTGGGIDRLTQVMAQVAGANVGARLGSGGGSIQTANIGSNVFKDMTAKLLASPVEQAISDAVKDPKLFRALLERSANSSSIPSLTDASGRTFGSWLMQLPMYNGENDEQTEQ